MRYAATSNIWWTKSSEPEKANSAQDSSARYSATFRKAAGILKRDRAPHDEWHIDWAIIGQQTLGLNGESYALVVLDIVCVLLLQDLVQSCSRGGGEDSGGHVLRETTSRDL